ncbi:hypothetical protein BVC80_8663g11 [Macleaya cordata]|uniref:Uncharacterized protein n=1 Tax=Macleaya cordata TaxID=56857 RepID=A0A200R075_MACCD|nr:hypothetical protein BVC80_8663g11 [Macleaya cordata]
MPDLFILRVAKLTLRVSVAPVSPTPSLRLPVSLRSMALKNYSQRIEEKGKVSNYCDCTSSKSSKREERGEKRGERFCRNCNCGLFGFSWEQKLEFDLRFGVCSKV